MTVPLPPLALNAWLRWDVVRRMLPEGRLDVLEVGAGQGAFAARLARRYRYVGLEPDPTSFAVGRVRVEAAGGELRNIDRSGISPDERFDLVICCEVLEHLEDDLAEVSAWPSLLRSGGRVVVSVPSRASRMGAWDRMVGHYRRYDRADIEALLTRAGFVDVQVIEYGMPLGFLLETARNVVATGRGARATQASMGERTGSSARQLQPSSRVVGAAAGVATWPFRVVQRWFPRIGTGLVASARLPDAAGR